MKKILTTPPSITPAIETLCRQINPERNPVWVAVRPLPTATQYEFCFLDALSYQQVHGGRVRYGWAIWEMQGCFLEAQFHAVWESEDGSTLIDVNPKRDGEQAILFLPDPKRVWRGKPIPSVRAPLSERPCIQELIRVRTSKDALQVRYATDNGTSSMPFHEIEPLNRREAVLIAELRKPTPRERAEERKRKRKSSGKS